MQLFGEIGLMPEEVSWLHERAGKLAFSTLSDLLNPESEFGKVYRKFQRASEQGDRLATDKCKNMMRRALLGTRKLATMELLTTSPYAKELQNIMNEINADKIQKGQATVDFMNSLEAGAMQ